MFSSGSTYVVRLSVHGECGVEVIADVEDDMASIYYLRDLKCNFEFSESPVSFALPA